MTPSPSRAARSVDSLGRLLGLLALALTLPLCQSCSKDADSDSGQRWVGTWASGQQLTEPHNLPPEPGLAGNTLRQMALVTIPGERLRVRFSNEWGNGPVTFSAVRIAKAGAAGAIDPAAQALLCFEGEESVTIPAGETRFSDPADFSLQALSSIAITIHFGEVPSDVTGHPGSRTTSYLARGDAVSEPSLPEASATDHWYYIAEIDVEAGPEAAAIVTLGDSITDGRGSTTNGNDRWPDQLARRLGASDLPPTSVLNMGIGGNAVVAGGLGPTATKRFDRDVLQQRGVRWAILLEGVNDIGGSSDAGVADRLIAAFDTFAADARAAGVKIYASPILPFGGSFYDSEMHEAARQKVNKWIRESGRFDAVIDLEKAVADPENPTRLLPAYDTGDHLHLSPAGYQAMADAIDLSLFER